MKETRARSIPLVVEKKKEEKRRRRRRRKEAKRIDRGKVEKKEEGKTSEEKLIRQLNRDVYHPFPIKFQKFRKQDRVELAWMEQEILNV